MQIVRRQLGTTTVLESPERLDLGTSQALSEAVDHAFARAGSDLLIDMERASYVSSIGLSALLRAAKLADAQGGRLALVGLRGHVRELFEMAALESVIDAYPNLEEALATLASETPPRASGATELATGLCLAEELLLLALHDSSGQLVDLPEHSLDFALAGAVILDLQLRLRVDADPHLLRVVDARRCGDPLLDAALSAIRSADQLRSVEHWVELLANEGDRIRRHVIEGLATKGILQRKDSLLHWVLGGRRYPLLQQHEQREVKARMLAILERGEVPGPRDVAILALADACAVFDAILEMDRMLRLRPRLEELRQLDLLARAVVRALGDAQSTGQRRRRPASIFLP
ncbi:MAG: anti-sigma factor antagonist [Planctomycetes bacterium]|nr:anti-sigma factor antagonist [Planctomycetota bacterium]